MVFTSDRRFAYALARRLLAFLIVANLPFWAAQHLTEVPGGLSFIGAPRGCFSLDYLVMGIAALYIPMWLWLGCFVVIFVLDAVSMSAAVFFFSQQDLIVALEFVTQLPAARVIGITVALLLSGAALAALCWIIAGDSRPEARTRQALSLGCLACILSAGALITGQGSFAHTRLVLWKPASSAGYKMAHSLWTTLELPSPPTQPIDSATRSLGSLRKSPGRTTAPHSHNLVLVLVESYGLMTDPRAADVLRAAYKDPSIQARYEVESGSTPFRGATVPGEFRELCGMSASLHTTAQAGGLAALCLPKLMEQEGYTTTSFHGFSAAMFNRAKWYRDIGFENSYFLEQMSREQVCDGPFRGTCDVAVGELVRKQLMVANKPQFVYWVTLNSHLPVSTGKSNLEGFGCSKPQTEDASLCIWRGLVERVHSEVVSIALDPKLPPTEFIIVGDHAPPFISPKLRSQFSQERVPYIHLTPRLSPRRASFRAR